MLSQWYSNGVCLIFLSKERNYQHQLSGSMKKGHKFIYQLLLYHYYYNHHHLLSILFYLQDRIEAIPEHIKPPTEETVPSS